MNTTKPARAAYTAYKNVRRDGDPHEHAHDVAVLCANAAGATYPEAEAHADEAARRYRNDYEIETVYTARKEHLSHPHGSTDSAGRWHPAPEEDAGRLTATIRAPSRRYPYSYANAARTRKHAQHLAEHAPDYWRTVYEEAAHALVRAAVAAAHGSDADRLPITTATQDAARPHSTLVLQSI